MLSSKFFVAIICFACLAKSHQDELDVPPSNAKLGGFSIFSMSDVWFGNSSCYITVNWGRNLCEGGRGHNIVVVVNPTTYQHESVSFDTYKSDAEKKRMIDYLKYVEMYSLIIMAVHETTSDRGWKQEWIDYMDGYGTDTVVVDGRVIVNEGCPFSVARRSWTLVTQKLPLINGVREAPKWAKCAYKSNPGGIAHIVRYVPLEKPCEISRNRCDKENGLVVKEKLVNSDLFTCRHSKSCHVDNWCDEKYSVAKNLTKNFCEWNGKWSNNYECPVCESIFGLDENKNTKEISLLEGGVTNVQFYMKLAVRPSRDFFFIIQHNKKNIASYNPFMRRRVLPSRVFYKYPSHRHINLTSSDFYPNFSASEDGLNFVILINYIARNSGDSDEFTLLVADYNRRTEDNTGLGEQYVVHNYTKVVKVNDLCGNKCPNFHKCAKNIYGVVSCVYNEE